MTSVEIGAPAECKCTLTDKVALVTGASRGIGREVAIALAKAGAHVALISRTAADLEAVANSIRRETRSAATTFLADVSNPEQIATAVNDAIRHFGRLDVAVVNAGIYNGMAFLEATNEQWREVIETNIVGSLLTLREVGRQMCRQGSGSVIAIGSICGRVGGAGSAVYSLSKAAVMQLTKALAVEWARNGVRLNSICPGWISTDLNAAYSSEKVMQAAMREIPLRRLGEPADVAPAVVFLASDASSYVTGQEFFIDGGQSAR